MALFDPIELEGIRYYRVEDNHLYVAFHSNETDVCYLTAEHLFPHDPPGEVVRLIGCQEQSGYAANTVKLREDLVEYLKYLQEIYYAYKVRHLSLTILVDSDSWLSTEFFLDIDKDFPGIAVTDIGKLNFEELKKRFFTYTQTGSEVKGVKVASEALRQKPFEISAHYINEPSPLQYCLAMFATEQFFNGNRSYRWTGRESANLTASLAEVQRAMRWGYF